MTSRRWKPAVTVAAVIEQQGRYLLVEERTAAGLQLNTPAGHLEPGESPQAGAVREALEETGRLFAPSALLGVYLAASTDAQGQPATWLRLAFCGTAGEPDPARRLDQGIVRTLWLTPAEIEASRSRHRSPLVWRCVQDHLRGQRFDLSAVVMDPSALGEPPS
ncbi:MAG: NUDIX hydrolase [Rubrivivax sp.]|nr:NUDIX hydrolase [Rubrivivax sp.]HNE59777.1 NUDIX hydrolase [Ottowia sp.]HNI85536.1 NUDIX hydrolase [Ottowia sp.]HNJ44764.1 NUDIX hydrolase [Ottowia sp.]HNK53871.1 NUDIX hydrolase [Ottowia sp.]